MKKMKLFLTGFALLAVVGSALAFNEGAFGSGSVYCDSVCSVTSKIDVRVDNVNGIAGNPCGSGTPHVLCGDGSCISTVAGTKFSPTATGR